MSSADQAYNTTNDGRMATGFHAISGNRYYFKSDGVLRQDDAAVKISGDFYYIGANGVIEKKTGWLKKGSDYYYVKGPGGKLATGWFRQNSTSIFYLSTTNAKMFKGVKKIDGKLYFFNKDGYRATTKGWKTYDGKDYYTYADGTCAVNTIIDNRPIGSNGVAGPKMSNMDAKAQGYTSNTSYLILIDTSTHKIGVYKGSKGNWASRTYESCADGNSSHRTPTGTFTMTHSMQYEDSSAGRHWYVTDFGSSSIWSVPYVKGTDTVADGTLGKAVDTAGCVRVRRDTAEWIYDGVPNGTKVVVY